ncbi:glycosyltransferase family 2 protein [Albirhodobacter sp. R86504]|uniref:glycosyltransferase family 2 protein n=1 Tax=Albirhodobacter sp. R86504 TaxID=3093848 RepID=UPI00367229EF
MGDLTSDQSACTQVRKVSCVIPAFNEAARIAAVLQAAVTHPLISEVIVVDDGSGDATAQIAQSLGAHVICQPRNGGKARALAAGIGAARGELLLMLDADLQGLDADAITRLLEPVLAARADVSISLRGNAPRPWRALGLDYISGERVLPRDWVSGRLHELDAMARFGCEVWLNKIWIENAARVGVVRWDGVRSPLKAEKSGWVAGIRADFGMIRDIFQTVSPMMTLQQIVRMRGLRH